MKAHTVHELIKEISDVLKEYKKENVNVHGAIGSIMGIIDVYKIWNK